MTAPVLHHHAALALTYRNAAKVVQARGLAKGCYQEDSGSVCTVGALLVATGMEPDDFEGSPDDVQQRALTFLDGRMWLKSGSPDVIDRIAEWNDESERTAADVVELLLDAALAIEAREAGALVPTQVRLRAEVSA